MISSFEVVVWLNSARMYYACITARIGAIQTEHKDMGDFTVPVTISPMGRRTSKVVDALVDTGSTYSVMPSSLLDRMGIEKEGEEEILDAFNQVHRLPVGVVRIAHGEKARPCLVLFGPEDQYLLGAIALESLGYMVDPIGRELISKTARI